MNRRIKGRLVGGLGAGGCALLLMFPLYRNSIELSIAFVATGILLVAAAVFFHFKD